MDPHLLDKLKARLGSRYRIERELGGGGMSRVYLAEELELGRMIVLKVLPPELGAVLSAERFEREVRLAASLQHPHIVTLLASGSADGILYYTMPFVEGESLRTRLDREGELPVSDVVRLLVEIVDALGYAHSHRVIHRDIKPENILLSHGHAVITDFGIARALSVADESSRLTGSGISIGTPAYMAPEQAAGEREIDHRADLYSVGVLAYELLAGEPPFRGPTAQALIAAHMTRTPPPVSDLRPSVSPELTAIVSRLLEKRPSDRFQRTEDVLAALQSVTGPGITATRAAAPTPTATLPSPAVWPLPRVIGYFAVAGAALLGAAWGLRTLLGLPDWFFAAAVVLLALGLPIVIAAALAHNRRLAQGPGHRTPDGLQRRLTLRRAVNGGVAAFSGLGLVTAGYMGMRAAGIGPAGTLMAAGTMKARDRLIIADFTNQTRDSLLGPAVTQAFRVDFAQSRLVSPVEPDYVRRMLRLMQRPDSTSLDLATAQQIARRGGLKVVIAGELQQVGPSTLVSAQLVSADSGQVLFTARATAKDSTAILAAVDRVSKQLRNKIGESLRSIRGNPPLDEVTTGSLDALRRYSQAIRAEGRGDNPGAIELLENAVAADTGFAMAWRKLGTMLNNEAQHQARADSALTLAFQLRDRLTFRERKLTENSYYLDVRGSPDSAAAAVRSLVAEYPDDSWAYNNLGVAYEVSGNPADAEQAYLRSATLDPDNLLAWLNIVTVRIARAHFDSATAAFATMRARFPAGPRLDNTEVVLELARRDYAAGEARLRALVAKYPSNPAARDRFTAMLAGVLTIRGKLAEADRTLVTLSEARAARGARSEALAAQLARTLAAGVPGGDARAARAILELALKATPMESLPERERPQASLIRAWSALSDEERALRAADPLDRTPGPLPTRVAKPLRLMLRGIALAVGKQTLRQSIGFLQKAESFCKECIEATIADAFDRLGMTDSALVYYQRWAETGEGSWNVPIYHVGQAAAYLRMGELYEAKGDTTRAVDFYGRFTELWREADPALQPRVKEAKRRIAELQKSRG